MEKIELSLSPKYVTNWGLNEAIREILQNCIDGNTLGYTADITYNNKKLTMVNNGTFLTRSTLLLGESGKNDSSLIGKYGEGYKLALLVLTRLDKKVEIYTNGEKWTSYFDYSETFKQETLCISIEKDDTYDIETIAFEINDIEQHEMLKLREKFIALDKIMGRGVGSTRESEYGTLLLNSEFAGKFFVNGLYVQDYYGFKYGYDFKSEYVDLDRDRRAINYFDLKELTTKILTSCGDAKLLVSTIIQRPSDIADTEIVLENMDTETAKIFKQEYFEKYDLKDDTFIGTEAMIEISGKDNVRKDSELITKIIFKANEKEEEYDEIKQKLKKNDDKSSAIKAFNTSTYKKLLVWFYKNEKKLSKKAILEFKNILENEIAKPIMFNLIKDDIKNMIESEM